MDNARELKEEESGELSWVVQAEGAPESGPCLYINTGIVPTANQIMYQKKLHWKAGTTQSSEELPDPGIVVPRLSNPRSEWLSPGNPLSPGTRPASTLSFS
jgi:hypothetical protein